MQGEIARVPPDADQRHKWAVGEIASSIKRRKTVDASARTAARQGGSTPGGSESAKSWWALTWVAKHAAAHHAGFEIGARF